MIYLNVTKESQTEKVLNRIARCSEELELVNKIIIVLQKFEGKPITKRIATACQKVYLDYRFSFDIKFGIFYLDVHKNGNKIISCVLGYCTSNRWENPSHVSVERFKEHNQCYLLNAERIPRLKAGLNYISDLVAKRDEAISLLKDVENRAKLWEMEYDFKLTE